MSQTATYHVTDLGPDFGAIVRASYQKGGMSALIERLRAVGGDGATTAIDILEARTQILRWVYYLDPPYPRYVDGKRYGGMGGPPNPAAVAESLLVESERGPLYARMVPRPVELESVECGLETFWDERRLSPAGKSPGIAGCGNALITYWAPMPEGEPTAYRIGQVWYSPDLVRYALRAGGFPIPVGFTASTQAKPIEDIDPGWRERRDKSMAEYRARIAKGIAEHERDRADADRAPEGAA